MSEAYGLSQPSADLFRQWRDDGTAQDVAHPRHFSPAFAWVVLEPLTDTDSADGFPSRRVGRVVWWTCSTAVLAVRTDVVDECYVVGTSGHHVSELPEWPRGDILGSPTGFLCWLVGIHTDGKPVFIPAINSITQMTRSHGTGGPVQGDILYYWVQTPTDADYSVGHWMRLPIGTAGQVLTVATDANGSKRPIWAGSSPGPPTPPPVPVSPPPSPPAAPPPPPGDYPPSPLPPPPATSPPPTPPSPPTFSPPPSSPPHPGWIDPNP